MSGVLLTLLEDFVRLYIEWFLYYKTHTLTAFLHLSPHRWWLVWWLRKSNTGFPPQRELEWWDEGGGLGLHMCDFKHISGGLLQIVQNKLVWELD